MATTKRVRVAISYQEDKNDSISIKGNWSIFINWYYHYYILGTTTSNKKLANFKLSNQHHVLLLTIALIWFFVGVVSGGVISLLIVLVISLVVDLYCYNINRKQKSENLIEARL